MHLYVLTVEPEVEVQLNALSIKTGSRGKWGVRTSKKNKTKKTNKKPLLPASTSAACSFALYVVCLIPACTELHTGIKRQQRCL